MTRRNVFIGAIILLITGALLFYFGATRKVKSENSASKTERTDNDSIIGAKPAALPEMGAKPEKNQKDGSIKIIEDFIKSNVKNPDTFEFLEWSEVSSEDGYWKVRCKYKGTASFGTEVTTNAWFYIRHDKVVYTKIISKI